MKIKNYIVFTVILIILSIQFVTEIIFTSNIPTDIKISDILILTAFSIAQFLIILIFVKEKILNAVLIFLGIFLILSIVKLINISQLVVDKTYSSTMIFFTFICISMITCVCKKKLNKTNQY